jgi:UDP-glucose 4-epimerase
MKTLVTGGAGFIGSHLVDALIAQGHTVVVVDNLSTGSKAQINSAATFIEMDVQDPTIASVFAEHQPEIVFHLAAHKDVRKSVEDPVFDATQNILATLRLLEAGRANGLKKFIFSSSGGAIYGDTTQRPTPETFWPAPISPYGITKWTVEHYLHFYQTQYGLPYVALRYANVYGPRQTSNDEGGVVSIFAGAMLKNEPVKIFGDGSQTRDFVFVADVVAANIAAMASEYVGAVNVGTGTEISVNALAETLKAATQSSSQVDHVEPKLGEVQGSCLDVGMAKEKLGWTPSVTLEQGIAQTVEWFRK